MTERQLHRHYEALQRLRRRQRAERLSDTNIAMAGGKVAQDRLRELGRIEW